MRALLIALVGLVAAGGDNVEPDILDQLNALPGVSAIEDAPPHELA